VYRELIYFLIENERRTSKIVVYNVGVTEIYALGKGNINQKIAQGSPTRNGKKDEPNRRGENITNSNKGKQTLNSLEFTYRTHLSLFLHLPIGVDKKRKQRKGGREEIC